MSDPRLDSYRWAGGREPMLRFGPDHGPRVVMALPLFEEANRTRAFGCSILRALAVRGIGGMLPDLPGQGDSTLSTEQVMLADWRAAFAAVPASHAVAIRSGALVLDDRPCWLLAPQPGSELVRELTRINGGPLTGERVEVAGNMLSRTLLEELSGASAPAAGARVVRLASDPRPATMHVPGEPLWRRAEPANDHAIAQALAADIVAWIAMCEG